MRSKTGQSQRPRNFSFAVDREEIGVTSEWADVFIAERNQAAAAEQKKATDVVEIPVAETATGEGCSSVETQPSKQRLHGVSPALEPPPSSPTPPKTQIPPKTEPLSPAARTSEVQELTGTVIGKSRTHESSTSSASEPVAQLEATIKPLRKPRPLRSVADGLTPGQFVVYSQMYRNGEGSESRIYKGGYCDLCRLTGLSKRGVQNVMGELRDKGVVTTEVAPGHHRTEVTVYRVLSEADLLAKWRQIGYRYVIGKGRILLLSLPTAN